MNLIESFNKNKFIKNHRNNFIEIKETYHNSNIEYHYFIWNNEFHGYFKWYHISGELGEHEIWNRGILKKDCLHE